MYVWIERQVRAVRNRVRRFRRTPAYDTFLGVLCAVLVADIISRLF